MCGRPWALCSQNLLLDTDSASCVYGKCGQITTCSSCDSNDTGHTVHNILGHIQFEIEFFEIGQVLRDLASLLVDGSLESIAA